MTALYTPGIIYERSQEERRDVFLAWQREDKAFFAAGACHILAHLFLSLHAGEGYELIHLNPIHHERGHHMYASNGIWAFDFAGWIPEKELLTAYEETWRQALPGWEYERIVVTEGLPAYCLKAGHLPPEYFPYSPWERAYNYIKQFPVQPPADRP